MSLTRDQLEFLSFSKLFDKTILQYTVHHSDPFTNFQLFSPSLIRIMTAYCSPLPGITCKVTPLLLNPLNQRHVSHGRELVHKQTMGDGMAM